MTDSLKFGPEWLRNLAGDGYNSGGGGSSLTAPKYQLAEYRYGREEMLALFDRAYKPPEPLTGFTGLYASKTQLPLALIQMTEDETRLWNGGVTASTGRGRGGSVDRGGRSRSGRTGSHYRGVGFDDDGPRTDSQPFPVRTRAFDRPPNERGWSERNGDTTEWNGSTSPRKELSRGASGSSLMESNWRRHRGGGEDEEGWRTNTRGEKWAKGSWRDADKDRERADGDEDKRGERWDHKGANRAFDPHPPPLRRNRSNHHDNHDNLPEWATENPSESGGSFDSSGAFHGMCSDDDDDHGDVRRGPRGTRVRRVSEGNQPHSKGGPKAGGGRGSKGDRPLNGERPKSLYADTKDSSLADGKAPPVRRSLSPIKSPPAPASPAPSKKMSNDSSGGSGNLMSGPADVRKKDKLTRQQEKAQREAQQLPAAAQGPSPKSKLKNESPKKVEQPKPKADRNKAPDVAEHSNETKLKPAPEPKQSSAPSAPPDKVQAKQQQQQAQQQLQQQRQQHQQKHQQSVQPQLQQQPPQLKKPEPTTVAASILADQSDEKNKSSDSDHLVRMEEEVAKLIDGVGQDEKPVSNVLSSVTVASTLVKQSAIDPAVSVSQTSTILQHEKWFYRDPQGEMQGPFLATEMAEWHKQGYFAPSLLVRRTCDERYARLGDLINVCGTVPFKTGVNFAPLKQSDTPNLPGVPPVVIEDPMRHLRYQSYQFIPNEQMILLKQLRTAAIATLSRSEQWPTLSAVEQNQLVLQFMRSVDPALAEFADHQPPLVSTAPFVRPPTMLSTQPTQPTQPSNSVLQLFPQLHQVAKTQAESVHLPVANPHPVSAQQMQQSTPIDPIQQLMQQMSMRNLPPMPQPTMTPPQPQPQPQSQPPPPQEDNPIKSWLRQLGVTTGGLVPMQQQQPQPQSQLESVWHQPPPPQLPNPFNAQSWMSQVGAIQPALTPDQMPGTLWDILCKGMKTEQQILEEHNLELQELQKEKQRKKEELERQAEQERMKREQEEELVRLKAVEEAAAKRAEIDKKKREEDKRRREEEKRRQEEDQRKVEEKRRKEEERRREEKRKADEEANKKKQEEEKKKRDEQKRQEEKLRKEEEKRKKLEEEQRKQEEERLRKEEEARKKLEAEEATRKADQRRREAEALRKLQERSKAPWAQAPPAPSPTAQASLAEIQRLEKEKKAEELRVQQLMQQQQLVQQKASEAAQEALTDSAKRLQFKWAEKSAPVNSVAPVKSLAQIQHEEQERLARAKHQEKERQEKEKASQKESVVPLQNVSIWGAASQSLNWSSTANAGTGGFWDDPAPKVNAVAKPANASPPKQATKQHPVAAKVLAQQQQHQQQQMQQQQLQQQQLQQIHQLQQQMQQHMQQNNKVVKNKNKKEEELVKKLFEQNTAKTDDFTQWCNKALTGLQVSVDIPTFIGFLRDIEAAYEVKEYVRMYLGDGKQCSEFAKQFLEKRSKWRSAQRPQTQADDLCKPAPAVNPNSSTEFQEVKSKSKKPKKGKMFKVDSQMLGFSVMSAPDRINVGDRDYADGV